MPSNNGLSQTPKHTGGALSRKLRPQSEQVYVRSELFDLSRPGLSETLRAPGELCHGSSDPQSEQAYVRSELFDLSRPGLSETLQRTGGALSWKLTSQRNTHIGEIGNTLKLKTLKEENHKPEKNPKLCC